jgi:hypothetical protein
MVLAVVVGGVMGERARVTRRVPVVWRCRHLGPIVAEPVRSDGT